MPNKRYKAEQTGPVVTSHIVASRVSGSKGFVGQWRDIEYLQRHADMTLNLDNQALHIGYPTSGQYIDAHFDGVETAVTGPHAIVGFTYTARQVGPRKILTLAKHNGEIFLQGSFELSADGRVVTESWWNPDQTGRGILVYEKK